MEKTYKFLAVKNATHLKIAVAAKQAGQTIDAYLNLLIKDCEPNCPGQYCFSRKSKPKKNK